MEDVLKRLRAASVVIGNAPELPGYNGSVLMLDDEEAARCAADIDDGVAEIERMRAALTAYANPLNWNEDSDRIRRVWLEPDSSTPTAYNGFEAARAALKA